MNPMPTGPQLTRRSLTRYAALLALTGGLAPLLSACGSGAGGSGGSGSSLRAVPPADPGSVAMANVARAVAPPTAQGPAVAAVTGFTEAMAARLIADTDGNLVCSPYSVAAALGMTVNGARGRTAEEMLKVLGGLSATDLNAGLALVESLLESRAGERQVPDREGVEIKLSIANSLWGQRGVEWQQPFLTALAQWYGAGMRLVDYAADPEPARRAINAWVAAATKDKIPELLASGILRTNTRLVLVNALYFAAPWATPFEKHRTAPGAFTTDTGAKVSADLMVSEPFLAAVSRGSGWQAVSMPYAAGQLAMTVVLTEDTSATGHAQFLAGGGITRALAGSSSSMTSVTMPKWRTRANVRLKPLLSALGMGAAFTDGADFSGISTSTGMVIDEVVHEGFIAVDEEGTEAAAATAVVMREVSAPLTELSLVLDRPFLYVIHDVPTKLPLFVGRVTDPTAS